MPRLFVAIQVPETVGAMLERVPHQMDGVRWASEAHLTLRFIGEVGETSAAEVTSILGEVRSERFSLSFKGAGTFPARGAPRVLWLGVEAEPRLITLQERIEEAIVSVGLAPEKRAFHPHVTLARLGSIRAGEVARILHALSALSFPPSEVDRFSLFSSVLGPGGACHRQEATYLLG